MSLTETNGIVVSAIMTGSLYLFFDIVNEWMWKPSDWQEALGERSHWNWVDQSLYAKGLGKYTGGKGKSYRMLPNPSKSLVSIEVSWVYKNIGEAYVSM